MQLQDILYSQGFGTRRICTGLIQQGRVSVFPNQIAEKEEPFICHDPLAEFDPAELRFCVQGEAWQYHAKAYLLLHKPAGTECSQRPSAHPSVYTLLPPPLRQRPAKGAVQGVQAVGRLDQDTTGLLLLSDDGHFIHKMTSPKSKIPKVYEVVTTQLVTPAQVQQLLEGVMLDDDPRPVQAQRCAQVGPTQIRLTLTEGRYHQVKRMVAAAGNRVAELHRSQIGGLVLPEALKPGQWRWLSESELEAVQSKAVM